MLTLAALLLFAAALLTGAVVAFAYVLRAQLERALGIFERRVAIDEKRGQPLPRKQPMPLDIVLAARKESEVWAQEQYLTAANEAYEKSGSWDEVRGMLAVRVE